MSEDVPASLRPPVELALAKVVPAVTASEITGLSAALAELPFLPFRGSNTP